jgi:hypothetical protein
LPDLFYPLIDRHRKLVPLEPCYSHFSMVILT